MRTSAEIYYQLTWDSRFEPRHYSLGVQTRKGVKEVAVVDFDPKGDIPWHRILYVRGPQGLVWDRAQRLDILKPDATGAERLDSPWVASLNCCSGKYGLPDDHRIASLASWITGLGADVFALQEVGAELRKMLEKTDFHCVHSDELLLLSRLPPRLHQVVPLPYGKNAIVAHWESFRLAAVHLSSDYQGCAAEQRLAQWQALLGQLGDRWIVAGDFNAADEEVTTWPGLGDLDPGPVTFDPEHNALAAQTSRSGRRRRLDRILSSGHWPSVERATLSQVKLSDHFPIWARFAAPGGALSPRSALAILPQKCPQVDALRRQFDPAFGRWPPHLNLLFPAPLQLPLDSLAQALAQVPSFSLRLDSIGVFEHTARCTVYWSPDDPSRESLLQLRNAVLKQLGLPDSDRPFQPHLTLGRLPKSLVNKQLLSQWREQLGAFDEPVNWVAWLRRHQDEPFMIEHDFDLASRWRQVPAFQTVEAACQLTSPGGQLDVVGSSLWLQGRDLDLVYSGNLDGVSALLPPARDCGQVLRFQLEGFDIDLGNNPEAVADARALRSYLRRHQGEEAFRSHYERVMHWVELRKLSGQAYGWPGGLAWAVLAALWDGESFWEQASACDWDRPVGLFSAPLERSFMRVLAPSLPARNLTRWVTASNLGWLRQEWKNPSWQAALPQPPYLRLPRMPGRELEVIVTLEKRFGKALRPWPPATGDSHWHLGLWPQADAALVQALEADFTTAG